MPRMLLLLLLSINEDMTSAPLLLPFDGSPDALHAVRLLAGWTDTLIAPVLLNVQPALPRF